MKNELRLVAPAEQKALPLLMNSIYSAHEGEGIWLGIPQVFVRFQGCVVGCQNCDTKETWSFDQSYQQTLAQVLGQISELLGKIDPSKRRVSITGGDPLDVRHLVGLKALISVLKGAGVKINVEAAGLKVVPEIFDLVDFISMDFKTPSTGLWPSTAALHQLLKSYGHKAQIKAVIADRRDFERTFLVYSELKTAGLVDQDNTPWVLTPCFEPGQEAPRDLIKQIYDWNWEAGGVFRVVTQQHKWIYGSSERLV